MFLYHAISVFVNTNDGKERHQPYFTELMLSNFSLGDSVYSMEVEGFLNVGSDKYLEKNKKNC